MPEGMIREQMMSLHLKRINIGNENQKRVMLLKRWNPLCVVVLKYEQFLCVYSLTILFNMY